MEEALKNWLLDKYEKFGEREDWYNIDEGKDMPKDNKRFEEFMKWLKWN